MTIRTFNNPTSTTTTTMKTNTTRQLFSSTESLDSVDVTPTALFRGGSFDTTIESESEEPLMNRKTTTTTTTTTTNNTTTGTTDDENNNNNNSSSNSSNNKLHTPSNSSTSQRPQFRNNLYPHLNRHLNLNNGIKNHDFGSSRKVTSNKLLQLHRQQHHYNQQRELQQQQQHRLQQQLQQQQLHSQSHSHSHPHPHHTRSPSLSKYSAAEAAEILFPPIVPKPTTTESSTTTATTSTTITPHHIHDENNENNLHPSRRISSSTNAALNISTTSTSSPMSISTPPKCHKLHTNPTNHPTPNSNSNSNSHHSPIYTKKHHDTPNMTNTSSATAATSSSTTAKSTATTSTTVTVMKEKNLNISQDTDSNTVVTEVMATSTDEDSFDISPLPRSPSKKQVVTTSSLLADVVVGVGVGVGTCSSSASSSSSSSTTTFNSSSLSSTTYSNSRKRTSSDRKKNKPRRGSGGCGGGSSSSSSSYDENNTNGIGGTLGLQPRSSIFSPTPHSSHKKNMIARNSNEFRFYRGPSIEQCHSFDSHDSTNTSCSNNDFVTHMMDATNSHNSSGNTTTMTTNTDPLFPQSISKPPQYTKWSSFIFSGSPIEEEENEDSCSPFHLNGKKPKRVDERRFFDSIDTMNGVSVHSTGMNVEMRLGGEGNGLGGGEDDHFSSKIRRLNLDGEMDCTNDDVAQDNSVLANGVDTRPSSAVSSDRLSLSSDEGVGGMRSDHNMDDEQQQQQQRRAPLRAREDSFLLHVNTDFQASLNNDIDDDTNQGAGHDNIVSLRTLMRNTESPLPPPTIGEDDGIVPPPNTFSSPPPILKKGLHDPPSPYRMGRIRNLPLPPTTPMVPQKAMRRMNNCSSPFLHGLPSTGRSNRSTGRHSTDLDGKSRFHDDFEILDTLGKGSFGTVFKCRQRVDGRLYAVKVAKRRAKGRADLDRMLKEVIALAELSDAAGTTAFHIVRYHQAWMEDEKLHIVTELCTSTLQIEMHSGIFRGNTKRLYKLLREMLLALKLVHKQGLVHLDIKPENIFVREDTFKLGDFGLVSNVSEQDDVEEGDSRYMSMDLLSGDYRNMDLTKCDIFSLGITMYEIVQESPLPVEGPEWQDLRAGRFSDTLRAQPDLQNIIKSMMDPEAKQRPKAAELLTRRQLLSEEEKQLILEQNRVREANMALAFQEERFRRISSPKRGLTRSNTCPR